jgi:hypothetical protein
MSPPLLLIQISLAAVWLYEGLWCKLLGGVPHQLQVVEAHPLFNARTAGLVLRALGVVEVGLGVWVLTGWQPVLCALAQTALLVFMNVNGLLFARRFIPDPAGMVVKNFALVVLMWVAADRAGG